MGIGIEREYDQRASLHDYLSDTGYGLMGVAEDPGSVPKSVTDFCIGQYKRFNIPLPPIDVIEVGSHATLMTVDYIDPYCLYLNGMGVEMSNDWCKYGYEISDIHLKKSFPANPENLETFKLSTNNRQDLANEYLLRPGLFNLPCGAREHIESVLNGEWFGEDAMNQIGNNSSDQLLDLCTDDNGELNKAKLKSYFELPAWATWCWLFLPEGQAFLFEMNEVYYACSIGGECVLYEGVVIDPSGYNKIQAPPKSCSICQLDSWCVDLVMLKGGSKYICEHHLNGSAPLYEEATCGSKACRHVECKHHPRFGQQDALASTLSKTGQLVSMSREKRVLPYNHNKVKLVT